MHTRISSSIRMDNSGEDPPGGNKKMLRIGKKLNVKSWDCGLECEIFAVMSHDQITTESLDRRFVRML